MAKCFQPITKLGTKNQWHIGVIDNHQARHMAMDEMFDFFARLTKVLSLHEMEMLCSRVNEVKP